MIHVTLVAKNLFKGVLAGSFAFLTIISLLFLCPPSAQAESFVVTATVHAPAPTQPALITSHYDQQRVSVAEAIIKGTCSNDTAYVELRRNDEFAGMTICNSGSFEFPLTFLPGANILYTIALSSTANPGPSSPPITVYYDIPIPPPSPEIPAPFAPLLPPSSLGGSCNAQTSPLSLSIDPVYQEVSTGAHTAWKITIKGGCAPHGLIVDWGDGIATVEEFQQTPYTATHVYSDPGIYTIQFKVTDASGQRTILQVISVVKGNPIEIPPPAGSSSYDWVTPTLVVAAAASFTASLLFLPVRRLVVQGLRWLFKK